MSPAMISTSSSSTTTTTTSNKQVILRSPLHLSASSAVVMCVKRKLSSAGCSLKSTSASRASGKPKERHDEANSSDKNVGKRRKLNHDDEETSTSTSTAATATTAETASATSVTKRELKRVSFSTDQLVLELNDSLTQDEKLNTWYQVGDYTEFLTNAHQDAQILRQAAMRAPNAKQLFLFIQNNPELSPRGLEKIMHLGGASDSDDSSSDSDNDGDGEDKSGGCGFPTNEHYKRVRYLKWRHRQEIVSMHRQHKERGSPNEEDIRKFSEESSQWAVEKALKLGYIDANGLI